VDGQRVECPTHSRGGDVRLMKGFARSSLRFVFPTNISYSSAFGKWEVEAEASPVGQAGQVLRIAAWEST